MKKKYTFTKDSKFTHVKDKMHQSVTEHIVEDEETKKLYHDVVSYGSWFRITDSSVFMSHLLKEVGLTGFCEAYIADDCGMKLPWYPSRPITSQSVVELPEDLMLKDFEFGYSKTEKSDEFKQTFLGKEFEIPIDGQYKTTYTGEDLLKIIFGCSAFQIGHSKVDDKHSPLFCLLSMREFDTIDEEKMATLLSALDKTKHKEIVSVLEAFSKIDIESKMKEFDEESAKAHPDLCTELLYKQLIIDGALMSMDLAKEADEKAL